jgi:hypothetical protein
MDDVFLASLYEILSRRPGEPVPLDEIATAIDLSESEAGEIAERLQRERLVYRFPQRTARCAPALVITRAGVLRVVSEWAILPGGVGGGRRRGATGAEGSPHGDPSS